MINNPDLQWMLNELVDSVPGTLHTAVVSGDGLLLQRSNTLSKDQADSLAAAVSSQYSVAKSPALIFGSGPVQQIVVQYSDSYLLITDAGHNAYLAAYTSSEVDMGTITFEMNRLVDRVGQYLQAADRGAVPAGRFPPDAVARD